MLMRCLLTLILALFLAVPAGAEQEIPNEGGGKIKAGADGGSGEAQVDDRGADMQVVAAQRTVESKEQEGVSIRFNVKNLSTTKVARGVVVKIELKRWQDNESPRPLKKVVSISNIKLDGQDCTIDTEQLTAECPATDFQASTTAAVTVTLGPKTFGGVEEFYVSVAAGGGSPSDPDGTNDSRYTTVNMTGSPVATKDGEVRILLGHVRKPLTAGETATLPDKPRTYLFSVANRAADEGASGVTFTVEFSYERRPLGASGDGPARIDVSHIGEKEGVRCTSTAGAMACQLGELPAGQSKDIEISVVPSAPGELKAVAKVSIKEELHQDSRASQKFRFKVADPRPELDISAVGNASRCGQQIKPGCIVVVRAKFEEAAAAKLGPRILVQLGVRGGGKQKIILKRLGPKSSEFRSRRIPIDSVPEGGAGKVEMTDRGPRVHARDGHVIEAIYNPDEPGAPDYVLRSTAVGPAATLTIEIVSKGTTKRVRRGEQAKIEYLVKNLGSVPTPHDVFLVVQAPDNIADMGKTKFTGCVKKQESDDTRPNVCKLGKLNPGEPWKRITVTVKVKIGSNGRSSLVVRHNLKSDGEDLNRSGVEISVFGREEVNLKFGSPNTRKRSPNGRWVSYDFTIVNKGSYGAKKVILLVGNPAKARIASKKGKHGKFCAPVYTTVEGVSEDWVKCEVGEIARFKEISVRFTLEAETGDNVAIRALLESSSFETKPDDNEMTFDELP